MASSLLAGVRRGCVDVVVGHSLIEADGAVS